MAIFGPFTNGSLSVDGKDLSNHIKEMRLNYNAAMLDATCMSNSTKVNLAGVKEWSIDATAVDDFAAGEVDAKLFPLVGAAAFTVIFKPDAASANPTYSGSAVLTGSPVGGPHGALLTKTFTLQCAGTLARATA